MDPQDRNMTIDEQIIDYLKTIQQTNPNSFLKYSVGDLVLFEHKKST